MEAFCSKKETDSLKSGPYHNALLDAIFFSIHSEGWVKISIKNIETLYNYTFGEPHHKTETMLETVNPLDCLGFIKRMDGFILVESIEEWNSFLQNLDTSTVLRREFVDQIRCIVEKTADLTKILTKNNHPGRNNLDGWITKLFPYGVFKNSDIGFSGYGIDGYITYIN